MDTEALEQEQALQKAEDFIRETAHRNLAQLQFLSDQATGHGVDARTELTEAFRKRTDQVLSQLRKTGVVMKDRKYRDQIRNVRLALQAKLQNRCTTGRGATIRNTNIMSLMSVSNLFSGPLTEGQKELGQLSDGRIVSLLQSSLEDWEADNIPKATGVDSNDESNDGQQDLSSVPQALPLASRGRGTRKRNRKVGADPARGGDNGSSGRGRSGSLAPPRRSSTARPVKANHYTIPRKPRNGEEESPICSSSGGPSYTTFQSIAGDHSSARSEETPHLYTTFQIGDQGPERPSFVSDDWSGAGSSGPTPDQRQGRHHSNPQTSGSDSNDWQHLSVPQLPSNMTGSDLNRQYSSSMDQDSMAHYLSPHRQGHSYNGDNTLDLGRSDQPQPSHRPLPLDHVPSRSTSPLNLPSTSYPTGYSADHWPGEPSESGPPGIAEWRYPVANLGLQSQEPPLSNTSNIRGERPSHSPPGLYFSAASMNPDYYSSNNLPATQDTMTEAPSEFARLFPYQQ
ncbi:hypothetical protein BCR39DRAFT_588003 [Naematelia encephala]|uniref:Uncharacterized protein n=1 Tax=Naematelia encephala TaxID=71784 RepID=A0A1Y2B6X1_9TREE|nr:hypothetical protein BCR39DRAFT_588003 [Naematelia encephala]